MLWSHQCTRYISKVTNEVLEDVDRFVLVYLDDIVISTNMATTVLCIQDSTKASVW